MRRHVPKQKKSHPRRGARPSSARGPMYNPLPQVATFEMKRYSCRPGSAESSHTRSTSSLHSLHSKDSVDNGSAPNSARSHISEHHRSYQNLLITEEFSNHHSYSNRAQSTPYLRRKISPTMEDRPTNSKVDLKNQPHSWAFPSFIGPCFPDPDKDYTISWLHFKKSSRKQSNSSWAHCKRWDQWRII